MNRVNNEQNMPEYEGITGFISVMVVLSAIFFGLLGPAVVFSAQSTITEADGYACMGDDKSKKQTEQQALIEAKRDAVEKVLTHIRTETRVKDFQLEKDVIDAYSKSAVKIIQTVEKGWYKDASSGDCYKIRIKAEVTPDEDAMKSLQNDNKIVDDPSAPLNVKLWTDKKEYRQGEKIKVFIKGNKPFYARVLYRDTEGRMVQLLPNPFRSDHYFNGGVIYELPSGNDQFELEVNPPFGKEDIMLYAGTSELGDINLQSLGNVYGVQTKARDIGIKTRGVKLVEKKDGTAKSASEFYEGKVVLSTGR